MEFLITCILDTLYWVRDTDELVFVYQTFTTAFTVIVSFTINSTIFDLGLATLVHVLVIGFHKFHCMW